MKRTLKRSRLPGMLAVLLTMSLVTAFGAPVAVADPDGDRQGKQNSSQSGPQECKPNQAKASDAQGRGCEESQKRSDNGTSSRAKRGDASSSESKSSKSDNSSRAKGSGNSKSNSAQSNSEAGGSKSNESKSRSEGKSSKASSSKGDSKSSSKGDSKSDSERKGSKGNNSKSKGANKGKRGDSRGNGAESHPPGNNGTVKIDGVPFDDHPDNEPHPGCTFQVDFYNYDEGDLSASVTFTTHPPTNPSGEIVLTESGISIGEDAAMGGTDLDATRTYTLDLSGYEPHDQQGHHIKLTVNAEGSIGADTKHKVFWVDCAADTSAPEDEVVEVEDEVEADRDEAEVTEEEEAGGRDEVDVAEDSVLGTIIQRGSPSGPAVVKGTTEVAGQQDAQQETRGAAVLPFTGAGLTAFIVLALALVGTGIAALATRRRSET